MKADSEDEVIALNRIFRQLKKDALSVAEDLLEAIRYWEKFCNIVMLYGIILTVVGIYYSFTSMTVSTITLAIIGVGSIFYALLIRRDYLRVRIKYVKLIEMHDKIKKELESGSSGSRKSKGSCNYLL